MPDRMKYLLDPRISHQGIRRGCKKDLRNDPGRCDSLRLLKSKLVAVSCCSRSDEYRKPSQRELDVGMCVNLGELVLLHYLQERICINRRHSRGKSEMAYALDGIITCMLQFYQVCLVDVYARQRTTRVEFG